MKELGFSMNEIDNDTIIIEGICQDKVSKKTKLKYEREFSKISLHLFEREYIERLQQIEIDVINTEKKSIDIFRECLNNVLKLLMK